MTAKEDEVEIWEDFVDQEKQLAEIYANNERPFRKRKRFLKKGDSILITAHVRPFVSEDLSLSGDEIRRVRISYDALSMLSLLSRAPELAEFVNLAHVQITCVPKKWTEKYLALPEIPWCEDPKEF